MNPTALRTTPWKAKANALASSIAVHAIGIGAAAWLCLGGFAHAGWQAQSARPFLSAVVEKDELRPPLPEPQVVPDTEPEPSALQVELEQSPEAPEADTEITPPTTAAVEPAPAPKPTRMDATAWLCRVHRTPPPQPTAQPAASDSPAAAIEPSPLPGNNPPPIYPWVPWRKGIEGTVVLRLEIDASGAVTSAEIVRSSGNGDLDREALRCLRTWRFEPARDAAGPHATAILKDVVFRIVDR